MAVKTKSRKPAIPTDSMGDPDIYLMRTEQGMDLNTAAEAAGITGSAAFRLFIRQEVEHNPDQVIKTKGVPKERLAKQLAKLRNEGVRWERLAARTGLTKTQIMEMVAEAEGVEPDDLKRQPKEAEDEAPKVKGKAKTKTAPARGKAKAKAAVDEDDEEVEEDLEDDEDEDEEPAPVARKTRGRARK